MTTGLMPSVRRFVRGLPLLVLAIAAPAQAAPPRFVFAQQPAILISIDGDPVYRAIEGSDYQRIVNTKAFIIRDAAGVHYLKLFDGWMEAYSLTGLWSEAGVPPLASEQTLLLAPRDAPRLDAGPLEVVVTTVPTELIVTDGPPRFVAVNGTSLQYVENTKAHVFKEPTDGELYILTGDGWFRSWRTDGPWELVPNRGLPADIKAVAGS